MVEFVKEFEQYILSENKEEAILSLIPGSTADQYFHITQKLLKIEEEFPQSLINEIEKFKKIDYEAYKTLKIHSILIEYDLPTTTQERKLKLIEMIKKNFFENELNFDYPKPTYAQDQVNEEMIDENENQDLQSVNKIEDKLDEKLYDPREIIKKFNEEEENLEILEKLNIKYLMTCFDPKLISEKKIEMLLKERDGLAFFRFQKDFLSYFIKFININKEDEHYIIDLTDILSLLSLEELEELLKIINVDEYKKIDLNVIYIKIIERKYNPLLEKAVDDREEREILSKIYDYIKDKSATKNNILKQDILMQLLENGMELNIYDFNYFIEYLKLPSIQDQHIFNFSVEQNQDFYKQTRRAFCNYTIKNQSEVNNIISSYLNHFFLHEKKTIDEFSAYLKYDFINREYQKALIHRGEENEEVVVKLFGKNFYEQLLKKVEITICKHNQKKFHVDEIVKLEVDLKNVQTLFVKIYEINTENYYFTKKSNISSIISLEGLIATYEESWSFNEKPQMLIRKQFELDKIPLRRGFYIVEFIGGGYSSRAVIKKGFLSVVQRNTDIGKMLYILNENSEICNTKDKTGIWFQNKFYTPNEKDAILIPYMKSYTSGDAILVHENFAEFTSLGIPAEEYVLSGAFIIQHESLIMGNTAKILFRPNLKINGQNTSLNNLENCKINLHLTKTEGDSNIPISTLYDQLTVNRQQEVEIEFQVPPKLVSINLKFECQVKNKSQETKQNLNYSEVYNLNTLKDEENVVKFYIRQESNDNYILYAFGRNAESKPNVLINVIIKHKAFRSSISARVKTNKEGKVFLGRLKDVISLDLSANKNDGGEVYNTNLKFIVPQKTLYLYPKNIYIIENEVIRLPYHKSSIDIVDVQLLSKNSHSYELFNKKLSIIENDNNHFYLEIKDLTEGNYILSIIDCKEINIVVHKGQYWKYSENFILKKDMLVEINDNKNPICIEKLEVIENNEDPSKSSIKIKVNSNSLSPRVNINLYQFLSNYNHYAFRQIKKLIDDKPYVNHPFKNWENEYIMNKELHEEIQYVFDRKQLERYMGISLEKPSLLMKRQFVRDTTVLIQEAKQGTDYKPEANRQRKRCIEKSPEKEKYKQYDSSLNSPRCKKGNFERKESYEYGNDFEIENCPDQLYLSGYHNWIVHAPLTINNLKPNENGEIIVENVNINNYGFLHVISNDEKSVCEEILPLSSNKVEKRDITLGDTLELNKFFAEIRKIDNLQKGQTYMIKDIISTKLKIIDSLEKVASFQTILNPSLNNLWSKFNFIFKFDQLSLEEQKKKFSEFFSHELNLFLFFRFPEIFKTFVRPTLKYKIEKTFIDYFLLYDEKILMEYTYAHKLNTLNTFEKCLLILVIRDKKPSLAKSIANSINLDGIDRKPNPILMNRFFNVLMNLKTDELNDLIPKTDEITRNLMSFCKMNDEPVMMKKMAAAKPQMMMMKAACGKREMFETASYSVPEIEQINRKNNLYKDNGKSKEFRETHYYQNINNHQQLVRNNLFWADLAKFWADGKNEGFLSQHILLPCENITELICLLSVLSLPISSINHQYNRKEGSALEIVSNSELIIFTNQIAETSSNITKDLMIAQHISKLNLGENNEKITVKEFLINEYYRHETIVTNISSNKINYELLIQIPQGAVPIKGSDYTRIRNQTLEKFNTISIETFFYFPNSGTFTQFPPNASLNGVVFASGEITTYNVKEKIEIKSDNQTLDDVLINGTKKGIIEFLTNLKTIRPQDKEKIYWMLKDIDCFNSIISIFKNKGLFDPILWSFGFYHNNEAAIKEYLEYDEIFRNAVGPLYKSSLIEIDESTTFNIKNHLDYHPIINARAHCLDKNTSILNKEFKKTYQDFIIYLLLQKTISNKDYLRLTYYLILQDRVDEAVNIFKRIDTSHKNFTNIEIQYDYIMAYLDFYIGYPDFNQAKEICKKYKNLPLSHWNELFEEIEDQLIEYGGEEIYGDMDKLIDDEKKKKQLTKEVIATEPKLSFTIENKNLSIVYSNVISVTIKFYFIDLEILFSRRPFLKQQSDDFSFVVPNYVKVIETINSTKEELLNFSIPEEFVSRNLFIEVSSLTKKNFDTYFSTNLKITITENLGEVKVTDQNLKPLNKVYVKCFAKMKNETIKFYKDGYTDLRGRFNYISLNTDTLGDINKFAVFIMDDNYGSIIKEINPPANIGSSVDAGEEKLGYDGWRNYRQEMKTKWKSNIK